MSKLKIGLVVASVAVMSCFALGAQARGGAGGAGGGNGGGHGSVGSGAGGTSGSHMSSRGMTNTNGYNSPDRDKGLERAGDRSHPRAQPSYSTTNNGKHKSLGRTK